MQPRIKVTVTDGSVKAKQAIMGLARLQVYVGIPETASGRKQKGSTVTNAELAFIHTHGARTVDFRRRMGATAINQGMAYPAVHQMYLHSYGVAIFGIPPRPIIEPAIEARGNIEPITEELKKAAAAQLAGNRAGAMAGLRRAGMMGQNAVRGWFTDPRNGWAPNKPSTIKRKGSDRPLIDTGELRKSVTYVVAGEDSGT